MSSSQPRREAVPLALEHDDVASRRARRVWMDARRMALLRRAAIGGVIVVMGAALRSARRTRR